MPHENHKIQILVSINVVLLEPRHTDSFMCCDCLYTTTARGSMVETVCPENPKIFTLWFSTGKSLLISHRDRFTLEFFCKEFNFF